MAETKQLLGEAQPAPREDEGVSRPVILEELVGELKTAVEGSGLELRVVDARVGVFYTGVKLNTGHSGVAYSPVHEIPQSRCCPLSRGRMSKAGALLDHPLSEFLDFAFSPNLLERAVGVAAINAVSQLVLEHDNPDYQYLEEVETLDYLQARPTDVAAIVGGFPPVIRYLKDRVKKIYVLEKNPKAQVEVELQPEEASVEILPQADLLIMTGATVVNHSFESLIKLATSARQILILGPTASMVPGPLFAHGVTLLGGIRFYDPDIMLRIVGEAGSGSHFYESCGVKTTILPLTATQPAASWPNPAREGQGDLGRRLRIDGLVGRPLDLTLDEVLALPQMTLGEWEGVNLAALTRLVEPDAEAKYLTIHSGVDASSLPVGRLSDSDVLLALKRRGSLLSYDQGGPLRLVAPSSDCFVNLKWVDRLEFTRERDDSLAQRLAHEGEE
jgi:uncharacterized protein